MKKFENYKEDLSVDETLETYWGEKISYNTNKRVFFVGENNFITLDAAKKYIQGKSVTNIQRKSGVDGS